MIPLYAALNHLLHQNAWARASLQPYDRKTIRLDLTPFAASFTLIDGEFVPAIENGIPDATITLKASAVLRRLTGQSMRPEDYRLEGDLELAAHIGKVLQQLEWEYEEDLSRLIGDIPAQQLVSFGKRAAQEGRRQMDSLAGMFAEYWQEEQPLIASRYHLDRFANGVDTLRNDVERLAKRLEKLERGL